MNTNDREIDTELVRDEYTPNWTVQSDLCDEINRLRVRLAGAERVGQEESALAQTLLGEREEARKERDVLAAECCRLEAIVSTDRERLRGLPGGTIIEDERDA